jgi:hypothetical protein
MKKSELRQLIRKLITEDDSTESYLAPSRFTFEPNDKRKDLMIHKLVDEYQEEIFDYLWNYSGYKNSFNEGVLKENDSYQLVLAQSANLEIPEDFEQLETREYKDMLNKLHDSYGEDKYTKEPAHFLSTAIDYILDDPREDDLKTAHEFLHKHKNAAAKELSNKNNFPSPQRGNRYSKKELRQMTGSIPKNLKWKTWYGDQAWRNSTNEYYRVKGDNNLMIKWLNDKIKDHKQSIEFDDYRDFKGDGLEMDREYIKGYTAFLTLLTGGWQGSLFE